jgi:hypothetical protein
MFILPLLTSILFQINCPASGQLPVGYPINASCWWECYTQTSCNKDPTTTICGSYGWWLDGGPLSAEGSYCSTDADCCDGQCWKSSHKCCAGNKTSPVCACATSGQSVGVSSCSPPGPIGSCCSGIAHSVGIGGGQCSWTCVAAPGEPCFDWDAGVYSQAMCAGGFCDSPEYIFNGIPQDGTGLCAQTAGQLCTGPGQCVHSLRGMTACPAMCPSTSPLHVQSGWTGHCLIDNADPWGCMHDGDCATGICAMDAGTVGVPPVQNGWCMPNSTTWQCLDSADCNYPWDAGYIFNGVYFGGWCNPKTCVCQFPSAVLLEYYPEAP